MDRLQIRRSHPGPRRSWKKRLQKWQRERTYTVSSQTALTRGSADTTGEPGFFFRASSTVARHAAQKLSGDESARPFSDAGGATAAVSDRRVRARRKRTRRPTLRARQGRETRALAKSTRTGPNEGHSRVPQGIYLP